MAKDLRVLGQFLEKASNGGAMQGCTPVDIYSLMGVYSKLENGMTATFVSANMYKVLEKCGIKVKPQGIGWVAMSE